MTAKELAQIVVSNDRLFILDVRNEEAFNDWKIEGKHISIINEPYMNLLDGVDQIIDQLPTNERILVLCAKEGSSKFVGDMLIEAGLKNVFYLAGGMEAWNNYLRPIKIGDLPNNGAIYQFVRFGKGCLSYMVTLGDEALIVDPIRMIDPYLTLAEEKGLTIKHIIDTHLHADHISGARLIREETGATYWLPPKDAGDVQYDYEPLTEESKIILSDDASLIKVMYTPGHTIGSTSIIVNDKFLLTGDILFVHSIGRPDLAGKAGEWASDLRNTLYSRYKQLADEMIVCPAHYSKWKELNEDGSVHETLGSLYAHNIDLQIKDKDEFNVKVSQDLPPQPNSFKNIRQTNMGNMTPDLDEQQEMENGPNRCAVSV